MNTLPNSIAGFMALAGRIAASVTRHVGHLNERIDAQPPLTGHRMGAWEISTSSAAQRAVKAMQSAEQQETRT